MAAITEPVDDSKVEPRRPPPAFNDLVSAPEFKALPEEDQSHAVEAWRDYSTHYGKTYVPQWQPEHEAELSSFTETFQGELEKSVRFTGEDRPYRALAHKIIFDANRPGDGLIRAWRDGVIEKPPREQVRSALELQQAIAENRELQGIAGGNQEAKALAVGAGRGAAFLGGAVGTAAGLAPLNTALTGVGGPLLGGAAVLVEGIAGGTIASMGYDEVVAKLAENNKTIESAAASAELHPNWTLAGELASFAATAPIGIAKGIRRFQLVAENLGKEAALKQAAQYVAVSGGIGAASAPIMSAVERFKNSALDLGHDEQADLFDPKSIVANTVLAIMLGNLGVKFSKYSAGEAASIHARGMAGQKLSASEAEVFSTINRKMAQDPKSFVFEAEQATMGGQPLGGATAARTRPIPAKPAAPSAAAAPSGAGPGPSGSPPPTGAQQPPPTGSTPPPRTNGTKAGAFTPKKASVFANENEFSAFMNAARKRGDAEAASAAWAMNNAAGNQHFFSRWYNGGKGESDVQWFANSVVNGRKNAQHAEFVRQQQAASTAPRGTDPRQPFSPRERPPMADAGTPSTHPRDNRGDTGRPGGIASVPRTAPPALARELQVRPPAAQSDAQLRTAIDADIARVLSQSPQRTAAETLNSFALPTIGGFAALARGAAVIGKASLPSAGTVLPTGNISAAPVESSGVSTTVDKQRTFSTRPPHDQFGSEATPVAAAIINDVGGIVSKTQAKKTGRYERNAELYDSVARLQHPTHGKLYNASGEMPDAAAQSLFDAGLIKDPSVGAMWKALEDESKTARTTAKESRTQVATAKQDAAFEKAASDKDAPAVPVQDLNVGDKVKVGPEEMRVVAIDPDSFNVTIEDGKRFGVQEVKDGEVIYGEHMPAPRGEADFTPERVPLPKLRRGEDQGDLLSRQREDLTLVGETKVERAAREAEQSRVAEAARQAEAQTARTESEKAQGNLFGDAQDMRRKINADESGGIPASLFEDVVAFGRRVYRAGMDFARFAAEMIGHLGDKVASVLHRVWQSLTGHGVRANVRQSGAVFGSGRRREPDAIGGISRMLSTKAFWEGSADVFLNKPTFKFLGTAINRQVDLVDKRLGSTLGTLEAYEARTASADKAEAKETLSRFIDARESGRAADAATILASASPAAKDLIKTIGDIAEYTGRVSTTLKQPDGRIGVEVLERTPSGPRGGMQTHIRKLRNLGRDFFPRIMRPEIDAVLRDPLSDPDLWRQMKDDLVAGGHISTPAEADAFIKGGADDDVASEFLGSLYRGRGERLPASWYDTSLEGFEHWAVRWGDIVSKIEAFGQKIRPNDKDLFDNALDETTHRPMQSFIQSVQSRAYNERNVGPAAKFLLDGPRLLASGLLLTNPVTIGINAVSSKVMNTFTFGLAANFGRNPLAMFSQKNHLDAYALGILKRDMVRLLYRDDLDGLDGLKNFTNKAMTWSGYTAVENLTRVDTYLTALGFLHDGLAAVRRNPESSASLNFLAWLKRNSMDIRGLLSGNADARDEFLRWSVKRAQGGYSYAEVPWWTDTPLGKFFLQFSKFSTMLTRNLMVNVFQPAFVGTNVTISVGGKTVSKRVFDVRPLLYFLTGTIAGGEAINWLKQHLFGIERKDATLDEIAYALDHNTRDALVLIGVRIVNDALTMGMLGVFGTPINALKDVRERNKFRNPLAPPGVSLFKNAGQLIQSVWEQGKLTARDVHEFVRSSVSMYRYADSFVKEQAHNADLDWRAAELKTRRDDVSFLRSVSDRYAVAVGIEPAKFTAKGRASKSPITPMRQDLMDALMVGEVERAKSIVAEYLNAQSSVAAMDEKLDALRESVTQNQPVKVGGIAGNQRRVEFLAWAKDKLSAPDLARINAVDSTYRATALQAGLMHSQEPWEELRMKLRTDLQRRRLETPAAPEQKARFLESNLRQPLRKMPPRRLELIPR